MNKIGKILFPGGIIFILLINFLWITTNYVKADSFTPFLDFATDPKLISKVLGGNQDEQNFKTDLATGAAVYNQKIDLPEGRNGLTSEVSLSYNSQSGADDSEVGYGWNLISGGSIERTTEYGVEDIYTTNEFNLSMNGNSGKLLPINLVDDSHGEYGLQVEEKFYKYEFLLDDSWLITDQNGTQYKFGQTTDSRLDDPNDNTRIFSWELDEITNTNNNTINYLYFKEDGQIYPAEINYDPFSVVFNRQARNDETKWYDKGFEVQTTYLISNIEVFIDNYANNDPAREYELTYTTGDNGRRSLLHSITERGRNEAGDLTELPPTEFTYSTNGNTYNFSESTAATYHYNIGNTTFQDLNGDGYGDYGFHDEQDAYWWRRFNVGINDTSGTSWSGNLAGYYTVPNMNDGDQLSYALHNVDLNGDALPETIVLDDEISLQENYSGDQIYFNYRNGFLQPFSGASIQNSVDREERSVRFGDFNGDGLQDVFTGDYDADDWTNNGSDIYLNTGANDFADSGYDSPVIFTWGDNAYPHYNIAQDTGSRLIDFNGDGLVDIIQAYQNNYCDPFPPINDPPEINYYLNTGDGNFVLDTSYDVSQPGEDLTFAHMHNYDCNNPGGTWYASSDEVCFVDITGDDIPDMIHDGSVYRFDGQDTMGGLAITGASPDCGGVEWGANTTSRANGDLNGDGMVDFFESQEDVNGGKWARFNNGTKTDLLINISESTGAEITYDYQSALQYRDDNDELLNPELPHAIYTVQEMSINDGLGNETTINYEYAGGAYYKFFNGLNGEFTKFAEVTALEQDRRTKYFYDTGCHDNEICSYGLPDHTLIRVDATQENYVIDGDYLREMTVSPVDEGLFQLQAEGSKGYLTYDEDFADNFILGEIWDDLGDDWNGNVDHANHALKGKLLETEIYDINDNLYYEEINTWSSVDLGNNRYFPKLTQTEKVSWNNQNNSWSKSVDYTHNNNTGRILYEFQNGVDSITGDEITLEYQYYEDLASYIIKPSELTTKDENDQQVAQTKYYYEANGNLDYQEEWLDTDNSYLTTDYEYDAYGNIEQNINPRNYSTSYVYDQYNIYPETITNALNQTSTYFYDYQSGEVTSETDPNGLITTHTYDGLGRMLTKTVPSPEDVNTRITETTLSYDDSAMPREVHQSREDGTGDGLNQNTYLDGLSRKVQEKQEGESEYILTDYSYDSQGNLSWQSLPHFESELGDYGTSFTYDEQDRILTQVSPIGTTTYTYDLWQTSILDSESGQKEMQYDAYDRLVQVTEHNDGDEYDTYYEYDSLHNLTLITDAENNIRNFSYDSLSRKTSQEDLHDPNDISFGTWTYEYDANNNKVLENTPNGDAINFTYDELDRLTNENSTYIYTYDTAVNGIGKLSLISSDDYRIQLGYDNLGNINSEERNILGEDFSTAYEYDVLKRLENITYPTNNQAVYTYNNFGKIETTDYDGDNVVSNIDYSQNGEITSMNYANGDQEAYTYDPAQNYLLTNKNATNIASLNLQNNAYQYDTVGNIINIDDSSDTLTNKNVTYTYDDLYRLTNAATAGPAPVPGDNDGDGWIWQDGDCDDNDANNYPGAPEYYDNADNDCNGLVDEECDVNIHQIGDLCEDLPPAQPGDGFDLLYDYNSVGNMISKSDIGDMLYEETGNANPQAVTSANGHAYEYDANGNQTTDGSSSYIYNYRNEMIQSTDANNEILEYSYDHDGLRVAKESDDGDVVYYAGQYHEKDITGGDTTMTDYIFVDDIKVMENKSEITGDDNMTFEQGLTNFRQPRRNYWESVNFENQFNVGSEIVVFSQLQSENGGHDSYIDLRNVSETGFQMRIEEDRGLGNGWLDGKHVYEDAGWLAFDLNELPEGSEGGKENFRQNGSSSIVRQVTFDTPFDLGVEPIIYAQIQTENGGHTCRIDVISVDENGFEMRLQEDTGNGTPYDWDGSHMYEDVAWIAFTPDDNPFGGSAGSADISNGWENIAFNNQFFDPPLVFALDVTENETDIAIPDIKDVTSTGFDVRMEELNLAGWDVTHADEDIRYFAVGSYGQIQMTPNDRYYYHNDHLGSPSIVTDENGDIVQTLDYYPFGGSYINDQEDSFDSRSKFTGKEMDETNLHYYDARYYDSSIGRFISQDPLLLRIGGNELDAKAWKQSRISLKNPNKEYKKMLNKLELKDSGFKKNKKSKLFNKTIKDPKRLNGYSYTINNPVKYIDPTGEVTEDQWSTLSGNMQDNMNYDFVMMGSASMAIMICPGGQPAGVTGLYVSGYDYAVSTVKINIVEAASNSKSEFIQNVIYYPMWGANVLDTINNPNKWKKKDKQKGKI